jgi:hypothetical protein
MKALAILASTSLIWCSSPGPKPAPKPDPGALTCTDACDNLRTLGCAEAAPTPDGASCEDVCLNADDLPVACITRAETCDAAEACE